LQAASAWLQRRRVPSSSATLLLSAKTDREGGEEKRVRRGATTKRVRPLPLSNREKRRGHTCYLILHTW
jgi:hypothetical protein